MTADEAWWARDLDVWDGVSEREFKAQWLAAQPARPDEMEQLEIDRKADRARLESSAAGLVWDPAKILAAEEVSRILEDNARETRRLLEADGQQSTASDDDQTARVWLAERALKLYGSLLPRSSSPDATGWPSPPDTATDRRSAGEGHMSLRGFRLGRGAGLWADQRLRTARRLRGD